MSVNFDEVYNHTLEHLCQAKQNIIEKRKIEHASAPISDVVPGFKADKLEFGSFNKENYAVLFVDMRNSTGRAKSVGAEKTFLTVHVYLTALLEVVQYYQGKVIDIMGDGLMIFWGGEAARIADNMVKMNAIKNAGLCGRDMLAVKNQVINKIIEDEDLGPSISIGIGVTFDSVIVTKIGIIDSYDVKAFGDCINTAAHYANHTVDRVKVSKKVKNEWPSGKNGKIHFISADDGEGYYLQSSIN